MSANPAPQRADKPLRSPIRWFGGKGRLRARIIPYFPPHKRYYEPFGGGSAMARQPRTEVLYLNPACVAALDGRGKN